MDLLPLLHIGIVLCDALQGELVHQVDGVGASQVPLLTREREREGRGRGRGKGGGEGREVSGEGGEGHVAWQAGCR